MAKIALITGITGQDGSYLTEFLLKKGYDIHGIVRRSSNFNTHRIDHLLNSSQSTDARPTLHYGDLIDTISIRRILERVRPDEIYNLGAQSHVHISFQIPEYTAETAGMGALRLLDAIRETGVGSKFYQASSSELFGNATEHPQRETTPFRPQSPYAIAKLFAYWNTVNYREAYNLFASNGILFNHESPRRGEIFVTRKVTRAAVRIKLGKQDKLVIGNLNASRDWGYAKDYVTAMWKILQMENADDYVIGSGKSHTVRQLCEFAFRCVGKDIIWEGRGLDEKGIDRLTGDSIIEVDSKYFRPTEVSGLQSDISKAKHILNWVPTLSFEDVIKLMIDSDLKKEKGSNIVF